jgi:hypothetical protein
MDNVAEEICFKHEYPTAPGQRGCANEDLALDSGNSKLPLEDSGSFNE